MPFTPQLPEIPDPVQGQLKIGGRLRGAGSLSASSSLSKGGAQCECEKAAETLDTPAILQSRGQNAG